MHDLPREPEAFTEQLVRHIRRMLSRCTLDITGPLEITLNDDPVDLSDFYRALQQEPVEDLQPVLERFVSHLLNARRLQDLALPLETVSQLIFPQICPLSFFRDRRADLYACQPFVNDTLVLYMIDLNGASAPVTTEQLVRWGIDVDQLDELARQNLSAHQPRMRLPFYAGGRVIAAVFDTGDGYDASRLLLEQLYTRLAPELGGTFLVTIPTRDVFIAFPTEPTSFVDEFKRQAALDYRKLPYPITDDLFLVTRDGVAGTAA
ncbi:MAG: DUF1444 family protein [Phycisphaeraceae bacterium]